MTTRGWLWKISQHVFLPRPLEAHVVSQHVRAWKLKRFSQTNCNSLSDIVRYSTGAYLLFPMICTLPVLIIRHRFGSGTHRSFVSRGHTSLDERAQSPCACLDKTAANSWSCIQLVTCGCKPKCSCFRKDFKCALACGGDAAECCNPAGQQTRTKRSF